MNILEYICISTIIFVITASHTIYRHYSERVFSYLTLDIFIAQLVLSIIPGINLIIATLILLDILSIVFEKISEIELFKIR